MSNRARELLELLYVPEALSLQEVVSYSTEQKSATGRFAVPLSHSTIRDNRALLLAESRPFLFIIQRARIPRKLAFDFIPSFAIFFPVIWRI